MKRLNCKLLSLALVAITTCLFCGQRAFAYSLPYLDFSGNYGYSDEDNSLTFTGTSVATASYLDGSFDYGAGATFDAENFGDLDPIIAAQVNIDVMYNTPAAPLSFSDTTMEVVGYFTADLTGLAGDGASSIWGNVSNIVRLDSGASRYLDELIGRINGGSGDIYLNFTPYKTIDASGIEHFNLTTLDGIGSGSFAGSVGAPVPPSVVLLASGLATLACRNSRRNRIAK
ncbi:MAG: hypothetical protein AB1568_16845 [Thermodesulfobacteriota bacterium]